MNCCANGQKPRSTDSTSEWGWKVNDGVLYKKFDQPSSTIRTIFMILLFFDPAIVFKVRWRHNTVKCEGACHKSHVFMVRWSPATTEDRGGVQNAETARNYQEGSC